MTTATAPTAVDSYRGWTIYITDHNHDLRYAAVASFSIQTLFAPSIPEIRKAIWEWWEVKAR